MNLQGWPAALRTKCKLLSTPLTATFPLPTLRTGWKGWQRPDHAGLGLGRHHHLFANDRRSNWRAGPDQSYAVTAERGVSEGELGAEDLLVRGS